MLADGYHDVPEGKVAAVVTHLEMHAPAMRGVPFPEGLTFAPLARDVAIYRDLFRRVGQDWLWFSRLTPDDAALAAMIEDPRIEIFALTRDGRPEALLELDFREAGSCELAYLGVTPALIGTGAGAWLMDEAQRRAFVDGVRRLHVHTCTLDSPQALGFYIRSGFVPYRRQVEVADDPRLTGALPRDVMPDLPKI